MPIVVEVKSQADYETWLAEQKTGVAVAQVDVLKEFDSAELNSKGKRHLQC